MTKFAGFRGSNLKAPARPQSKSTNTHVHSRVVICNQPRPRTTMINSLRKAVSSSPFLRHTRFASVSRPSLQLKPTLTTPLHNINIATRNAFAKRFMSSDTTATTAKKTWWTSAEFWGGAGAMAGWGMTGAAIWDATNAGPELISLNMTSVMLVYSSLFARWAWVVQPRNVALCACHVSNVFAQSNQMRRAVEHKIELGEQEEVNAMGMKAGAFAVGTGALIAGGPALQAAVMGANLGPVSAVAGAAAGPFTVHFWAPMSKWLISGASFLDLDRPTDKGK